MLGPDRLIIYARWPSPRRCKTRLGAAIGWDEATGVYARLLYGYLSKLLLAKLPMSIELSLASQEDVPFFAAAFPECLVRPQAEGDLGIRMWSSLRDAFAAGAQRVALTGSDIPRLGPAIIQQALEELETTPVTLGPASDGGYYLVGMRNPGLDLFQGIAWSTPLVLSQTLERARALGKPVALLPELRDLDNGLDYANWQRAVTSPHT